MTGLQTHTQLVGECLFSCRSDDCTAEKTFHVSSVSISPLINLQVPEEAGADLLCVPQPGRDERRRRPALQLAAHAEAANAERRLRGEKRHPSPPDVDKPSSRVCLDRARALNDLT